MRGVAAPAPRPSLLEWLLWSNVLMAGSAVGWVVVTLYLLALPLDLPLLLLAWSLAVAFYTRDRLEPAGLEGDAATMPQRTAWVRRHARALRWWMGGWALVGAGTLALRPGALPAIVAGLGFALSYTVRWLPWRGERVGWKHLPGMKMPFVAALWLLLVLFAPAAVYDRVGEARTWLLATVVWGLVMLQILLNDLRDREGDARTGTLSLPVLLGGRGARVVGYLLSAFLLLLTLPLASPALALVALYSALLLYLYRRASDSRWRPWIEVQGVVAALLAVALG